MPYIETGVTEDLSSHTRCHYETPAHRRERIATAVLAGMWGDSEQVGTHEDLAILAVSAADALIAVLNRPTK